MNIPKREINWKYFIGWKLFMYFSFLLIYFNCFYFVRQYSELKNEIAYLESSVVELQSQFISTESTNDSNDSDNIEIHGIIKDVNENSLSVDYVQLLIGIESELALQEDGKCIDEKLSNCGEEFYARNLNETLNDLLWDEDTKYSVLSSGIETGNINVTKDEFLSYFQNSDRKEFFVVSLIVEYDYVEEVYLVKEIHQIYTP